MFTALFFTVRAMRESKLVDNKSYVVPSLMGKKVEEAKELASLRGFTIIESEVKIPDEQYAEGQIIRQSPSAGIKGKQGDKITVVVSSGSDHTTVPDLIGKSLKDAMEAAEGADLILNDPIYMTSELPDGQIINQDPAPEASVFKNDPLTIWISGQEDLSVDMPQITGMTLETAIDTAVAGGFELIRIYPVTPENSDQEGKVIRQTPSVGMSVAKGTAAELFIGRSFLGDFTSDIAVNVDIKEAEKNVVIAAKIGENLEMVLYSAVMPVGDQQSISFTAYLPVSGEYPCIVYINGEKVRETPAVFTVRKAAQ